MRLIYYNRFNKRTIKFVYNFYNTISSMTLFYNRHYLTDIIWLTKQIDVVSYIIISFFFLQFNFKELFYIIQKIR